MLIVLVLPDAVAAVAKLRVVLAVLVANIVVVPLVLVNVLAITLLSPINDVFAVILPVENILPLAVKSVTPNGLEIACTQLISIVAKLGGALLNVILVPAQVYVLFLWYTPFTNIIVLLTLLAVIGLVL